MIKNMDLHTWLAKHRITKTDFAKSAGISREYVILICNGYMPREPIVDRILRLTNGEINLKQLSRDKKPKRKSAT